MKKIIKQSALTMPPPAKNTIVILFVIVFFNVLAPMANAQSLTLTASDYNGYSISCFGGQNGSINLTITGGTPPYTIRWSTDATTEDISNLPAGYYHVEVDDADTLTPMVEAEITLTEPEEIRAEVIASDYIVDTRHYNISLYGACNGSITLTATGGVEPYSCEWNPFGQTTTNLTNVCAGAYGVVVTDANGCTQSFEQPMTEPERSDWRTEGNTNSNPATHFLGTTDNQDLSFRTNNIERLKISATGNTTVKGNLNIDNSIFMGNHQIGYQAAQGNYPNIMSFGAAPITNPFAINCSLPSLNTTYQFKGQVQLYGHDANGHLSIMEIGYDGANAVIESSNSPSVTPHPSLLLNYYCGRNVFVCTGINGGDIQLGGSNSVVCVGMDPSTIQYQSSQTIPYKLIVNGKLGVKDDIYVKANAIWPDFVFEDNYKLPDLSDVAAYFKKHKHFKGFPSAKEVETNGQAVGLLQVKQQEKLEQVYLYLIKHNQRFEALEKQNALLQKQNELLEQRIKMLEK